MDTVLLQPLSTLGQRLVHQYGEEWVITKETEHTLVICNWDETTMREVQKRQDTHFKIKSIQ